MALRIHNVLGRKKQDFIPLEEGRVSMYVCGPTIYDHSHLGHAKSYVSFDVVVRYLRYSGYNVLYVQNLTDVGHLQVTGEDRILKKARQLQSLPMQIAEMYGRSYQADMAALNVLPPDIQPRATGHIPEQIEMIQELIASEHAYEVNGSVYFDVTSAPDYGKLSNRRLEEQEEGTREDVRGEKHHAADFALWKRAEEEHIMRWNSPWGEGFPGWHIECSAMAKKYLGATFDIHGGGVDNIYPHNENEIVQSECANNADFARYWMLVGSLTVEGEKMSKSLDNFVTIKDALQDYRPEVLRMSSISAHYRSPMDYSAESMQGIKAGWERLFGAVRLTRQMMNTAPESDAGNTFIERLDKAKTNFTERMDDDFNTPQAIAVLQELTRDVNTLLNSDSEIGLTTLKAINDTYNELGGTVLGIIPEHERGGNMNADRENALIQMLIDMRAQARAEKNFAESDRLRDELAKIGVILEDRADGTVWKVE
ncbi:MAG: cysteine--tRNA ligase [Anaerolineae bacterium]|nr:cysteine--tRNA ligase [Anaerolineae bacterium]MDQ7034280.1 cysteine--tRNA ligase [Anaerolineae bacterium]